MPKPIICLSGTLRQFLEAFRSCFSQRHWHISWMSTEPISRPKSLGSISLSAMHGKRCKPNINTTS